MVGDGIGDAGALARADVGIAMAGGVAAAGEAADIVLMGNNLTQAVDAIRLSRATFRKDSTEPHVGVSLQCHWAARWRAPSSPGLALCSRRPSRALMGFSSLGVMANSLALRWTYDEKHHERPKAPLQKLPEARMRVQRTLLRQRP